MNLFKMLTTYSGQPRGSKTHPPFGACTQHTDLSMAEVISQVTVKIERIAGAVGYDVSVCQEMLARYSAPLFIATGEFGVSLEQTGELERY